MSDLSDSALYEEGVRRLEDASLLYWYARLDMPTRHRLLAVANRSHNDAHVDASYEWLNEQNTLDAVLFMLITSSVYKEELERVKQSLQYKLDTVDLSAVRFNGALRIVNTK